MQTVLTGPLLEFVAKHPWEVWRSIPTKWYEDDSEGGGERDFRGRFASMKCAVRTAGDPDCNGYILGPQATFLSAAGCRMLWTRYRTDPVNRGGQW